MPWRVLMLPLLLVFALAAHLPPANVAALAREQAARRAAPEMPGWTESRPHQRLFTPLRVPAGTYHVYVSSRQLDEILAELRTDPAFRAAPGSFEPRSVIAAEAFGLSGGYNRWQLARLYGARRARVARGPRMDGLQPVEAWTLVSPYPDPALGRLEPGTLLIVLDLRDPELGEP